MSSESTQAVLGAVLTYIGVELKTRVGVFLDRAEQTLYAQTFARGTSGDRPASHAAARWLGENRQRVETAMQQRMTDSFLGRAPKKSVQYDELQMLDDDALGVVIVRARMVSQVMEWAREPVVVLEARLEALRAAGASINPRALSPGVIADGFLAVLNELDVPPRVQAPLLDAYGVRGVETLVEFYEGINKLLMQQGVLPDFKNQVARAPEVKGEALLGPLREQAAGQDSHGGFWSSVETISPPPRAAGGAPSPQAAASGVVPTQLMPMMLDAKITAMQQSLASLDIADWQPGKLLRQTFKLSPFALTAEQEQSIDYIEAVFLDLLRDPRISPRFRTEMGDLVLPLMTLRLSDAEQFADAGNAVRRFVRQLALLGFRDQEAPLADFKSVQFVVQRIVSERAQDPVSFKSGADALYTIAKNEVQRQIEVRQKTRAQSLASKNTEDDTGLLVKEAHRHVLNELRLLSAGLRLPSGVQQCVLRLLGPWMMVRYQRYGAESQPMRDARSFAQMFFSLLRPVVSDADRGNKIALRKHALEEIEVRAARAQLPVDERLAVIQDIEKLFDELNDDPNAGIARETGEETAGFVSYLDVLPETPAS